MLDPTYLRDDADEARRRLATKHIAGAVDTLDAWLAADERHRRTRHELEVLQARRNADSKEIGERKRRGDDASALLAAMAEVASRTKELNDLERGLRDEIDALALEIPNLPHASVPLGASERDNVVAHERPGVAAIPEAKPHWDVMAPLGWLDLEAGTRVAGAGFPVLRRGAVRLARGLEAWLLDSLVEHGFDEVRVPFVASEASATATGQLPDKEGQMYAVGDGLYLIPTSEVALANLHRSQIVDAALLPMRYAALTPCFRREAGSYGADVRGLNRVHQFDKVEMVVFTDAGSSYEMLEEMTDLAEALLSRLGLTFRRLSMCTADLGFTQTKKYDLEVFAPGQQRWLEVSSVSNLEAFQGRRLNMRYRAGGAAGHGKTETVHTLNGSAFGLARTLSALIETYQTEDGAVQVPEVLVPYVGVERLA